MAGYSGTPLHRKLGINPAEPVVVRGYPGSYPELFDSGVELQVTDVLAPEAAFIHYFATREADLDADIPVLKDHLAKTGALWVSWPKKTSGVSTDLDGNRVRAIGLATGLVDTKVAAVDETWSGLKFMWRRSDR